MKSLVKITALVLLLGGGTVQLQNARAQGSLTPPAAPGPTMKSLAQIEPRTPIGSAPFTINVPGSYYLTTNLNVNSGNAITIATNGVTLDLNGFTIATTANALVGNAIQLNNGLSDLAIGNGHIRSGSTNNGSGTYSASGFLSGISAIFPYSVNIRVTGVSVSGCAYGGIYLGVDNSSSVEGCSVRTVGGYGIMASNVRNSVAVDCASIAIFADQVSDCRAQSAGSSYGLYASTSAMNSYGSCGSGGGIFAYVAQNCYGSSGTGTGLSAGTALNCYGISTDGTGLSADCAQNCHGESTTGIGLFVYSTAQSCYASSGTGMGLSAPFANACYGRSSSGTGLTADMANGCFGSSSSGTGLTGLYGNFCFGSSVSVSLKYNMP